MAGEQNPYLPSDLPPLIAEMWQGIRTDTNRVGVPENYDFWLDGFFPYAPRRLRAMPDLGASIYHTINPTIVFYEFVNLGAQSLDILVMSDGSILQLNMTTFAVTTILPAGTILNPSQVTMDINQWGATYVLIVANQPNGYWIWDGSTTYTAGTIGPIVIITNVGSNYTSQPVIGLVGGSGSGAVFSAVINNGQITSVIVTNPGSGYSSTDTPTLTFSGGTSSGTGGSITAGLGSITGGSGGSISVTMIKSGDPGFPYYFSIPSLVAGGSGYSSNTKVNVSGGSPLSGNALQITPHVSAGAIGSITYIHGVYNTSIAPHASITDTGYWAINSTSIIAGGSGYGFPVLSVIDVTATVQASPMLTAGVSGGAIASVSIVSGGQFKASVTPTVVITDAAITAVGSVSLMPFGIQGNAVETYSGQVWIANGASRYTSAPGSVSDFATSDGGLSVKDNDSFLKVGYTRFIQMNGFLWMVADCSINYIGNVTTTGSPPVTNYSKQNADPEVGTIWPNTVIPWGNQLLLANSWGVFLGLGSRMQKVSDELDGIYQTVLNPLITPSVAKMTLFGRKIVFLLLPIVDPVSGAQQNKLLIWDGKKWWVSSQSKTLTYIATQEINSVLTAYGTDGNDIYPLFTIPSAGLMKTLQTRLWDAPGSYLVTKAAGRLFGVARYNSVVSPNLIIRVDNEATDTGSAMGTASTYTIIGPAVTGNFILPPQAVGQTGVFTGLTLQTNAADVEIVSLAIADEIVGYRG